jgi:3-hydroxypropanoate dehydrogenase
MSDKISKDALDQLFHDARTHNKWQDKPVSDELLRELADLMKMAPTSANCSPARLIFCTSEEAKSRLAATAMEANQPKITTAPACVIIGHDMAFYEHLPTLFPHTDAKSWFVGNDELIATTAFRNGTLQGAYLIMAARALGLDTGPMSGFDNAAVDAEFFAGTQIKSNFICSLGYGDPEGLFPRSPRFDFDDFAKIV